VHDIGDLFSYILDSAERLAEIAADPECDFNELDQKAPTFESNSGPQKQQVNGANRQFHPSGFFSWITTAMRMT